MSTIEQRVKESNTPKFKKAMADWETQFSRTDHILRDLLGLRPGKNLKIDGSKLTEDQWIEIHRWRKVLHAHSQCNECQPAWFVHAYCKECDAHLNNCAHDKVRSLENTGHKAILINTKDTLDRQLFWQDHNVRCNLLTPAQWELLATYPMLDAVGCAFHHTTIKSCMANPQRSNKTAEEWQAYYDGLRNESKHSDVTKKRTKYRQAFESEDELNEAVKLFNECKNVGKVVEEFGIAQKIVSEGLKSKGCVIVKGLVARAKKILHEFTKAEKLAIVERYKNGENVTPIAKEFDVPSTMITEILKAAKVTIRTALSSRPVLERSAAPTILSEVTKKGIVKMFKADHSFASISNKYGVDNERIKVVLRKAGVKIEARKTRASKTTRKEVKR